MHKLTRATKLKCLKVHENVVATLKRINFLSEWGRKTNVQLFSLQSSLEKYQKITVMFLFLDLNSLLAHFMCTNLNCH